MAKAAVGTTCKDAIAKWQLANPDIKPHEAKKVSLICMLPAIRKMDNKLNDLVACEHLSLSTNSIDKISALPGLRNLRILSLGRNQIKRIEKLEDVAGTLQELWLSYNLIDKLDGIQVLKKLRVLYLSNNSIKSFDELNKLRELPELADLLLIGNPIYDGLSKQEARNQVIRRLPKLPTLDGEIIKDAEREEALGAGAAGG